MPSLKARDNPHRADNNDTRNPADVKKHQDEERRGEERRGEERRGEERRENESKAVLRCHSADYVNPDFIAVCLLAA